MKIDNIYVVHNRGWGGRVKIGRTTNIPQRMTAYQTHNPLPTKIEILLKKTLYKGEKSIEKDLHKIFNNQRAKSSEGTEYFYLQEEDYKTIVNIGIENGYEVIEGDVYADYETDKNIIHYSNEMLKKGFIKSYGWAESFITSLPSLYELIYECECEQSQYEHDVQLGNIPGDGMTFEGELIEEYDVDYNVENYLFHAGVYGKVMNDCVDWINEKYERIERDLGTYYDKLYGERRKHLNYLDVYIANS